MLLSYTFLFVLIAVILLMPENYCESKRDTSMDFPRKEDLRVYLKSIEKIIKFCKNNLKDLDVNFEFGLFLINVNFKAILENTKKRITLPENLHSYLKYMVTENSRILKEFHHMARQSTNPNINSRELLISNLFIDESFWMKRLQTSRIPFRQVNNQLRSQLDLEKFYGDWNTYKKRVDDIDQGTPNPHQSDECLVSLANNSANKSYCVLSEPCYEILRTGSDYGYGLTHRLILLLQAEYGRGCRIFSAKVDNIVRKMFCDMAYDEAQYIAMNNYELLDLMCEQICICALDGNVKFLRRSWLSKILNYQTGHGCFSSKSNHTQNYDRPIDKLGTWSLTKEYFSIMEGECEVHVTAVAAVTYAVAVKFIIDNYY